MNLSWTLPRKPRSPRGTRTPGEPVAGHHGRLRGVSRREGGAPERERPALRPERGRWTSGGSVLTVTRGCDRGPGAPSPSSPAGVHQNVLNVVAGAWRGRALAPLRRLRADGVRRPRAPPPVRDVLDAVRPTGVADRRRTGHTDEVRGVRRGVHPLPLRRPILLRDLPTGRLPPPRESPGPLTPPPRRREVLRWRCGDAVHPKAGRWPTSIPVSTRAGAFGRRLRSAGLLGSMGSIGDCFDNSVAESFFGTLQLELLDEHRWATASSSLLPCSTGSKFGTTPTVATPIAGCSASPTTRPSTRHDHHNPPVRWNGEAHHLSVLGEDGNGLAE